MRRMWPDESPWFRVWVAFCGLVGLIIIAVGIWAVIIVVLFVTR